MVYEKKYVFNPIKPRLKSGFNFKHKRKKEKSKINIKTTAISLKEEKKINLLNGNYTLSVHAGYDGVERKKKSKIKKMERIKLLMAFSS